MRFTDVECEALPTMVNRELGRFVRQRITPSVLNDIGSVVETIIYDWQATTNMAKALPAGFLRQLIPFAIPDDWHPCDMVFYERFSVYAKHGRASGDVVLGCELFRHRRTIADEALAIVNGER